MTRTPKAKLHVLETAQRLVAERGTGALTFDALSDASGVTRGGITYHFPTKLDLLKALVARDMQQWAETERSLAPEGLPEKTASVVAAIRSSTTKTPEYRKFVSGMIGAAMLEPDLLDSVREFHQEHFAEYVWDETDLRLMMLRLAAEGLFWMETFDCYHIPAEPRARLAEMMESMALHWAQAAEHQSNCENNHED
ncbi:MAG: TetR/AcrR family transcriptional regulator [Pseudomonadota bacterium]